MYLARSMPVGTESQSGCHAMRATEKTDRACMAIHCRLKIWPGNAETPRISYPTTVCRFWNAAKVCRCFRRFSCFSLAAKFFWSLLVCAEEWEPQKKTERNWKQNVAPVEEANSTSTMSMQLALRYRCDLLTLFLWKTSRVETVWKHEKERLPIFESLAKSWTSIRALSMSRKTCKQPWEEKQLCSPINLQWIPEWDQHQGSVCCAVKPLLECTHQALHVLSTSYYHFGFISFIEYPHLYPIRPKRFPSSMCVRRFETFSFQRHLPFDLLISQSNMWSTVRKNTNEKWRCSWSKTCDFPCISSALQLKYCEGRMAT